MHAYSAGVQAYVTTQRCVFPCRELWRKKIRKLKIKTTTPTLTNTRTKYLGSLPNFEVFSFFFLFLKFIHNFTHIDCCRKNAMRAVRLVFTDTTRHEPDRLRVLMRERVGIFQPPRARSCSRTNLPAGSVAYQPPSSMAIAQKCIFVVFVVGLCVTPLPEAVPLKSLATASPRVWPMFADLKCVC